jgi:tetratricopeptide (TPR) repeat protein
MSAGAICFILLTIFAVNGGTSRAYAEPERAPAKQYDAAATNDDVADRGAIGIKFAPRSTFVDANRQFVVLDVVEGGPAHKSGVEKGDVLTAINGTSIAGLPIKAVSQLIRGEPGTTLILRMQRKSGPVDLTVTRGELSSIPSAAFKTQLGQDYEREERLEALKAAQKHLLFALGRDATFTGANPPLSPESIARIAENCHGARFAIDQNEWGEADRKLRRALDLYPNFLEARFLYALVLDARNKFGEAAQELKKVLVIAPKATAVWLSLASAQANAGQYTEALASLKRCVQINGDTEMERFVRMKIASVQDRMQSKQLPAAEKIEAETKPSAPETKPASTDKPAGKEEAIAKEAVRVSTYTDEQIKQLLAQMTSELEDAQTPVQAKCSLLRRIGECNVQLGDFVEALKAFESACNLNPPLDERAYCKHQIELIHGVLDQGSKLSPDTDNYVSEINWHRLACWNTNRPLRIYIDAPSAAHTPWVDKVKAAFTQWSTATNGKFKFAFLDNPKGAQIKWSWKDEASAYNSSHSLAETMTYIEFGKIKRATIAMKTRIHDTSITDTDVYRTALHEIGHALGVMAHSANRHDIMFPFVNEADSLSARDINTILSLYALGDQPLRRYGY